MADNDYSSSYFKYCFSHTSLMKKGKSVLGIVLSKLGGLLLFLIFLAIANAFTAIISSPAYNSFVQFLNNNIGIILLFSIIFFVGGLFSILSFPFDLPYPIFNSFGSAYIIVFLFRLIGFLGGFYPSLLSLMPFRGIFLFLVPLIILVIGYLSIFVNLFRAERHIKKRAEH